MGIPSVDDLSLEDLLLKIESWAQGRRGVESVPNMLRHLEGCLEGLSAGQQADVLLGLLKAFSDGSGTSVSRLVASLITSGALGGELIPVEVEVAEDPSAGEDRGLCFCPRCERNRARAAAQSKDMN